MWTCIYAIVCTCMWRSWGDMQSQNVPFLMYLKVFVAFHVFIYVCIYVSIHTYVYVCLLLYLSIWYWKTVKIVFAYLCVSMHLVASGFMKNLFFLKINKYERLEFLGLFNKWTCIQGQALFQLVLQGANQIILKLSNTVCLVLCLSGTVYSYIWIYSFNF